MPREGEIMSNPMLSIAIQAVKEASMLCSGVQASIPAAISKSDKSPVTVADFGAQAVVGHLLETAFPDIPLVGEEDADALRENPDLLEKTLCAVRSRLPDMTADELLAAIDRGSHPGGGEGRHWTLDPIDGTKGFLRGDQYAVALALIENGQVILGVLGCPNLPLNLMEPVGERGSIFAAAIGDGAVEMPLTGGEARSVNVDRLRELPRRRLCESVEKAHTSQSDSARVAELLGLTAPPTRIDSQCKYAAVARGDAEIYLRLPTRPGYVEKIWDHAAGYRVILEAGGRVSDVNGKPLDFSRGRGLSGNLGVVVTNGLDHERIISAVQSVLGLS